MKARVEEPTQADVVFWQSGKDSSNVDMVCAYLNKFPINKFPNSTFAELARIRIK